MLSPGCLVRITGANSHDGHRLRNGSVLRLDLVDPSGASVTGKVLNEKSSPDHSTRVDINSCQPLELPNTRPGERVFLGMEDFLPQQAGDLEFWRGDLILGEQELDPNWLDLLSGL